MGLFEKKTCALCSKECGMLSRTKIKNKEYICSDCVRQCSRYISLYKLDKDAIKEHMGYMQNQEALYQNVFLNSSDRKMYPGICTDEAIVFCDEIGMFEITQQSDTMNKAYHELFRYDQVANYSQYVDYKNAEECKDEKPFKEYGIKIKFVNDRDMGGINIKSGTRPHPYIDEEIKICFSNNEKDLEITDYSVNAIMHFDSIFGINDDRRSLFSLRGSKNEQRGFNAAVDMANTFASMVKAAKDNENIENNEELKAQFEKTNESINDAQTSGLSVYTRRADEALKKSE